ncbi:MAG TPA: PD-(D/E)XK nuclease family protein [Acidimicrobiia bacterium]
MLAFPPVPDGEDIRISATTFVAFGQCPERAEARLQGEYGPETVESFKGGLAHRIFARHLTRGPIAAEDFEQVCREEIGSSGLNNKVALLGLRSSSLGRVVEEVRSLYRRFVQFPTEGFAGSEVGLSTEPARGVELVGSIDAVFDAHPGTRLVDWKTGGLGEAEVQLDFYCLLWVLVRGELPSGAEAVSLATGERTSRTPSLQVVEQVAQQVADMVTVIRRFWSGGDSLELRGGPWCWTCPRLAGCLEGQAATAVGSAQPAGHV